MRSLLLSIPFIFGCGSAHDREHQQSLTQSVIAQQMSVHANGVFTCPDAAAILGEPCHIVDSTYSGDSGVVRFNSGYKADSADPHSGDTGAIYFVLEEYKDVAAAHKRYAFVLDANTKNGASGIPSPGDEAYYHTDNMHFRFIMARKSNRIIVMKINKLTSNTSDSSFRKIAGNILTEL